MENTTEELLSYSEPGQAGRKVITMTNGYHHEVDTRTKMERKDHDQDAKSKTKVAKTNSQAVTKAAATTTQLSENY